TPGGGPVALPREELQKLCLRRRTPRQPGRADASARLETPGQGSRRSDPRRESPGLVAVPGFARRLRSVVPVAGGRRGVAPAERCARPQCPSAPAGRNLKLLATRFLELLLVAPLSLFEICRGGEDSRVIFAEGQKVRSRLRLLLDQDDTDSPFPQPRG